MSNNQPNKPITPTAVIDPPTSEASTAEGVEELVEKPTRRQRVAASARKHKSTLIAGAGLVAVVGASAFLGRKSAPSTELVYVTDAEVPFQSDDVTIEMVDNQLIITDNDPA